MLACRGRVVVTGMGKSGHVANKIAATLASTGTPAFFVHPGEASHGDLGMITGEDLVLALSNSGETAELVTILPLIKRLGVKLIAFTGKPDSTLAKLADVHLDVSVAKRSLPPEPGADRQHHCRRWPWATPWPSRSWKPAASLKTISPAPIPAAASGRRLLLRVEDIMHKDEDIPRVAEGTTLSQALMEMTRKGLGMTAIVDTKGRVAGIFTDGDLRRTLDKRVDVHKALVDEVMTKNCTTVSAEALAGEALHLMESRKFNGLLVVGKDRELLGALNMHDLLRAGIV